MFSPWNSLNCPTKMTRKLINEVLPNENVLGVLEGTIMIIRVGTLLSKAFTVIFTHFPLSSGDPSFTFSFLGSIYSSILPWNVGNNLFFCAFSNFVSFAWGEKILRPYITYHLFYLPSIIVCSTTTIRSFYVIASFLHLQGSHYEWPIFCSPKENLKFV